MSEPTGIEKASGTGKEKDDKKVVAGGIAIMVVVILIIAWGYFFIQKIQSGSQQLQLGGGASDQFTPTSVKQAQEDYNNSLSNLNQELRDLRNQSSGDTQSQQVMQQSGDASDDQFTAPQQ